MNLVTQLRELARPLKGALLSNALTREMLIGYTFGSIPADRAFAKLALLKVPAGEPVTLILAHDTSSLAAAAAISAQTGAPVLLDIVETTKTNERTGYTFRQIPWSGRLRMQKFHERLCSPVAGIIAVSDPFTRNAQSMFGRPAVTVTNAFSSNISFAHPMQSDGIFRIAIPGSIRPEINISRLAEIAGQLAPNMRLELHGRGAEIALAALKKVHGAIGHDRLAALPPVSGHAYLKRLSQSNMAYIDCDPKFGNFVDGLPNRFWDAAAAGLTIGTRLTHGNRRHFETFPNAFLRAEGTPQQIAACFSAAYARSKMDSNYLLESRLASREMAAANSTDARSAFGDQLRSLRKSHTGTIILLSRSASADNARIGRQRAWMLELGHTVLLIDGTGVAIRCVAIPSSS